MNIKAYFSGYPVENDSLNLCEELQKNNIECPLQPGFKNFTWDNTVPTGLPSGTIKGTEQWTDENNNEILCFQYSMSV